MRARGCLTGPRFSHCLQRRRPLSAEGHASPRFSVKRPHGVQRCEVPAWPGAGHGTCLGRRRDELSADLPFAKGLHPPPLLIPLDSLKMKRRCLTLVLVVLGLVTSLVACPFSARCKAAGAVGQFGSTTEGRRALTAHHGAGGTSNGNSSSPAAGPKKHGTSCMCIKSAADAKGGADSDPVVRFAVLGGAQRRSGPGYHPLGVRNGVVVALNNAHFPSWWKPGGVGGSVLSPGRAA